MSPDRLLTPVAVPEAIREATSASAVLQAMLDAEAALVRAQASLSLVPGDAADAINAVCRADRYQLEELERAVPEVGNPVAPLVKAIRAELPAEAADFVHLGATSQDILDTALALLSRRVIELILAELDRVRSASAALAEEHKETLMVARTLLQQALPTTFGLKAAGWLLTAVEEYQRSAARRDHLAVQLGGAAGTLSWYGTAGVELLSAYAKELELSEPAMPWHAARARVAELGTSLAITAGSIAKIALDIVLLAQSEVGEVAEGAKGRGGSSTLPQKRNPIASVSAIAAAHQVRGAADVLLGSLLQEHERGAGAWHAEWRALRDALELTGGVVASVASALETLKVDPERMRANVMRAPEALVSEHLVAVLAKRIGRAKADAVVGEGFQRASEVGGSLADTLAADGRIADVPAVEWKGALDPASYLGSAGALIDRALAADRAARGGPSG